MMFVFFVLPAVFNFAGRYRRAKASERCPNPWSMELYMIRVTAVIEFTNA